MHQSPKIIKEIGGNDARYHLFSQGMDAFIAHVATRPDGRNVFSIGRRSRYIPFPIPNLYAHYNQLEGFENGDGWGGSDIIGGSSRHRGRIRTSPIRRRNSQVSQR
jgi:hypothetical protein